MHSVDETYCRKEAIGFAPEGSDIITKCDAGSCSNDLSIVRSDDPSKTTMIIFYAPIGRDDEVLKEG